MQLISTAELAAEAIMLRGSQALPASAISHTGANATLSRRQKLDSRAAWPSAGMRTEVKAEEFQLG